MNNIYVSDLWNLPSKGHINYGFLDIAVNNDTRLFIDPCLVKKSNDSIIKRINDKIDSFFDCFYTAFKNNDSAQKWRLLSHAGEENATKLGYGNGFNGKGNTANGLMITLKPLDKLLEEIPNINRPEDLPVLLPGFAEDGLSDLLTNIIHDELSEFTLQQMNKYGIEPNGKHSFFYWDSSTGAWNQIRKPAFFYKCRELLLVPKSIVRKHYLFSTSQFFQRIILEHMREDGNFRDKDGKLYPKKFVMEKLQSRNASNNNWLYGETINYTKQHNQVLDEYHDKIGSFYTDNGDSMSDEELDREIYTS